MIVSIILHFQFVPFVMRVLLPGHVEIGIPFGFIKFNLINYDTGCEKKIPRGWDPEYTQGGCSSHIGD